MKGIIQKHWTSLLGALFVVAAFVTLFKYSVDQGWITDFMKISFGILSGAAFVIAGVRVGLKRENSLIGEILVGLGACLLYTTFSFAGIYYRMWSPMTVMLGMSAVTIAATAYAYKGQSRLLMNIALAGGLLSPLMLRSETDQVFALFLYLLVLNIAFLFLSIAKGWVELKLTAFIGTWLLYIVYFVHFNPSLEGLWNMPIRYALAAFIFYTITLLASSWRNKLSFDGMDLYLNIANGVLFSFWSMLIWHGEVDYGYIVAFIGAIYVAASLLVYGLTKQLGVSVLCYGLGGLLLLLISISGVGVGNEIRPLISVMLWSIVAILVAVVGHYKQWLIVSFGALWIWFIVGCYWYAVTWTTPRGEWFGIYIPFLNWGAVAWMLLAGLGFYFARRLKFPIVGETLNLLLSRLYAFFSHLIVGGLLTRQVQNIYTEYLNESPSSYMQLALSVTWGVYALLLMLWGAYYRESFFRWFGAVVLVIVAIKAIFMDLSGQEALYKVAVLLVLGGISFIITWINNKWGAAEEQSGAPDAAAKELE